MTATPADYSGVGSLTPLSTWHVFGSRGTTVVTKTSTFLAADEDVILCDTASLGSFTANLPEASTVTGRIYHFVKIDSSNNILTVDANGSETINGEPTQEIVFQYDCIEVVSDGSNWIII